MSAGGAREYMRGACEVEGSACARRGERGEPIQYRPVTVSGLVVVAQVGHMPRCPPGDSIAAFSSHSPINPHTRWCHASALSLAFPAAQPPGDLHSSTVLPNPTCRAHCRAPAQTAVLVKRLRQALDALLDRKVRQPGVRVEEAGGSLIQSIVDLLNHEEAAQKWDR